MVKEKLERLLQLQSSSSTTATAQQEIATGIRPHLEQLNTDGQASLDSFREANTALTQLSTALSMIQVGIMASVHPEIMERM